MDVILPDDDRAAQRRTVEGWVSRDGFFFGDNEGVARAKGATHRLCAEGCGEAVLSSRVYCPSCARVHEAARYAALPKQEWDGVTPLVLFRSDQYFYAWEDVEMYAEEHAIPMEQLFLVICEPVHVHTLDPYDVYCELLSDTEDLPPEVEQAFNTLNTTLSTCKVPLSWVGGKYALLLPGEGA